MINHLNWLNIWNFSSCSHHPLEGLWHRKTKQKICFVCLLYKEECRHTIKLLPIIKCLRLKKLHKLKFRTRFCFFLIGLAADTGGLSRSVAKASYGNDFNNTLHNKMNNKFSIHQPSSPRPVGVIFTWPKLYFSKYIRCRGEGVEWSVVFTEL